MMAFVLRSSAFASGESIPEVYARAGGNQSPPLQWEGTPDGTKSLALIVEDPDAPFGTFTHWVLFDIPANLDHLPTGGAATFAHEGTNDFGNAQFDGPAPPAGHGVHHYHFRLCALDVASLGLPRHADYTLVKGAARAHVLAEATLIGIFEVKRPLSQMTQTSVSVEFPTTPDLMQSETFSQVAVSHGSRYVYTSGQVSVDKDGNLVGGADLAAQTIQAMRNVEAALKAAGASFADVVKTTTFVVGYKPEDRKIVTGSKEPFYKGRKPPTSALIGIAALAQPEWLIEIEAIAVLR